MGPLPMSMDANSEFVVMAMPKLSYTKHQSEIFIERDGWDFSYAHPAPQISKEKQTRQHKDQMIRFVTSQLALDIRLTKSRIVEGYLSEIDMTSREAKEVITQLIAEGRLVEKPLPKYERQGSRKTYLAPTPPERKDDLSECSQDEVKNGEI